MEFTMDNEHRRLFRIGGACGIISVLLYIVVVTLPLLDPAAQIRISFTFMLATAWPMIGVVYSYALYRLIALEQQGLANRFAFLLSLFGLATVTAMISVQLAVQVGIREYQQMTARPVPTDWESLLASFRLIDFGLDLAWDVFIGWSMIIAALPMYRHSRLGLLWAIPSFLLGLLLVGLNTATFPWPPASRGLFDIGPIVGLYVLLLSVWILVQGRVGEAAASGRAS